MGFMKEVTPAPNRYVAFQYDGTQQSLDDLAAELGPGASVLNLTRIDAATYQFTWVGTQQRDTDAVQVWRVTPNGELGVLENNNYPDDGTEYTAWWLDV